MHITRYKMATFLAVLFHGIGLIGMLYLDKTFFIGLTAFNLLLSFGLLVFTQNNRPCIFYLFIIAVILLGIGVEIIGVNTGALFGQYRYGTLLGYQVLGVPLIIGVNWFVIIYCCGISIHTLLTNTIGRMALDASGRPLRLKALSVIIDGATLAVFFDWVMEPVAMKLGYWRWDGAGEVPVYNYLCWFMVSVLLLSLFQIFKFDKQNKFAVNLLLIQLMFFLLLRTLMK